ncbi:MULTISPECIES: hypothetical protein [unclassified Psychrobacter]|uniref:hypothetical protein n=1 Tax=unclassified Psychrobacter TaxID=196806 RepID=UPI003F48361A
MKKTVLNTALSAAMVVTLGLGVTACSGDKDGESHEVLAVDKVEEAAELARQNAPEAEDMEFPETAPMPVEGADDTAVDGTEADATMTTQEGMTEPATAEATTDDTDATTTDSATTPATDTAATETDAEPETNE